MKGEDIEQFECMLQSNALAVVKDMNQVMHQCLLSSEVQRVRVDVNRRRKKNQGR